MNRIHLVVTSLVLSLCATASADGPYRPGSVFDRVQKQRVMKRANTAGHVGAAETSIKKAHVMASYARTARVATAARQTHGARHHRTELAFRRLADAALEAQLALNDATNAVASAVKANTRTLKRAGNAALVGPLSRQNHALVAKLKTLDETFVGINVRVHASMTSHAAGHCVGKRSQARCNAWRTFASRIRTRPIVGSSVGR